MAIKMDPNNENANFYLRATKEKMPQRFQETTFQNISNLEDKANTNTINKLQNLLSKSELKEDYNKILSSSDESSIKKSNKKDLKRKHKHNDGKEHKRKKKKKKLKKEKKKGNKDNKDSNSDSMSDGNDSPELHPILLRQKHNLWC